MVDLTDIRKRDSESAPTWFNGPPKDSAAARAIQDRRTLLKILDEAIKDAARYEWLRENWPAVTIIERVGCLDAVTSIRPYAKESQCFFDPQTLDHAIDFTMENEKDGTDSSPKSAT